MAVVAEFLGTFLEVDGSTITLLLLIIGSATYAVRNQVASVFTLLLISPMAMLVAVVAYGLFLKFGMFNPKNMGEWLMWTITAGTAATGVVLGAAALFAGAADRKEARLSSRSQQLPST